MILPSKKHPLMVGTLTILILVSVVCQSAVATCAGMLKVAAPACQCYEKKTSTAEKQHRCCQQKAQSKFSHQCDCCPKLPPANAPRQNESEITGRENLIAAHSPIAPEREMLHCDNPLQGKLTGTFRPHSIPLTLSLCVWLT